MYFQKPEQLLQVFTDLEEENLGLIQTSQETEEQFEDLRKVYKSTKEKMDKEAQVLQKQIEEIDSEITQEEEKSNENKKRSRFVLHLKKMNDQKVFILMKEARKS